MGAIHPEYPKADDRQPVTTGGHCRPTLSRMSGYPSISTTFTVLGGSSCKVVPQPPR